MAHTSSHSNTKSPQMHGFSRDPELFRVKTTPAKAQPWLNHDNICLIVMDTLYNYKLM